jgi:hypothetical protein
MIRGHTNALTRAISAEARSAASKLSTVTLARTALSRTSVAASVSQVTSMRMPGRRRRCPWSTPGSGGRAGLLWSARETDVIAASRARSVPLLVARRR